VHLALPQPERLLPRAAEALGLGVVTLHPGRTLDRAQIAGIVHLVSSSACPK
jgi:flagellar M-ring protein FliF